MSRPCLALWQVEGSELYDGKVALRSGPHHILEIRRETGSITLSVRHRTNAAKIDHNLVRSLRQFSGQTLQRIISLYKTCMENDDQTFFKIEYNNYALSRGIGPDEKKACIKLSYVLNSLNK